MKIKLLTFGQISELIGNPELTIGEVGDTNALRHKLSEMFPEITAMQFSLAVNKKMVRENIELMDGDIVALLPPFSGG